MLLDEHAKWSPWVWEQLAGLWEGIASWWVGEEEDPPPESLIAWLRNLTGEAAVAVRGECARAGVSSKGC